MTAKGHSTRHRDNWPQRALAIAEYLGTPATALEIHPRYADNSFEDLLAATEYLVDEYSSARRLSYHAYGRKRESH